MRWTWNSFLLALAFSVCFATFPANASETQTTPIDPTEDVERGLKKLEEIVQEGVAKVEAVVRSEAAMPVREAAARVLGSVSIPAAERAKLLEKLRG